MRRRCTAGPTTFLGLSRRLVIVWKIRLEHYRVSGGDLSGFPDIMPAIDYPLHLRPIPGPAFQKKKPHASPESPASRVMEGHEHFHIHSDSPAGLRSVPKGANTPA